MASRTVGYSGTPLAKKLGITDGTTLLLVDAPRDYLGWLHPLPAGVVLSSRAGTAVDVAHVFCERRLELKRTLTRMRRQLRPNAVTWVSWPKKASKVPTDITEDVIREIASPIGFVDIKVCAVTEVWSGLKLVVRRELR